MVRKENLLPWEVSMKLRGIDFGPCLDAAGVRGFFGEGYWFHSLFRLIFWGFSFAGSTFVAKTTTLYARTAPPNGNMRIRAHRPFWPVERFPRCIWWDWLTGRTLNAVGLAGPGAQKLFASGLLVRAAYEPFMISFMAVGKTVEDRIKEFRGFVSLLRAQLVGTSARFLKLGLQINVSCPNTGLDTSELVHEARAMLDIAQELEMPIVVKINLLARVEDAKAIADHPACDALCFTNSIPFGTLPRVIQWDAVFPNGSPLENRDASFGKGGYSGEDLLMPLASFSRNLRNAGVVKPFNVGGGIRKPQNIDYLVNVGLLRRGHDSIFFSSAAMVRPWRLRGIIRRAHERLGTIVLEPAEERAKPIEA